MRHAASFVRVLGADGAVTTVALFGIGAMVVAFGGKFTLGADGLAPLALLGVLLVLTAVVKSPLLLERRPGDRRRFFEQQLVAARTWAPFVLAYVAYRVLVASMNVVHGAGVEDRLKAIDERIFGISPSFWMQKFANPWLTDLMSYAYALMFFMPLLILILLYVRERQEQFRTVALSVLGAFYLGLVGYLLVPARSPRLVYEYTVPLHGALGLYEVCTYTWDRLQLVMYDAFPSLHTAISTISLVWAWRFGSSLSRRWPRLLFWIYLPNVILLQISTLYLRQHYFVDLCGGWTLAAAVVWLSPRLAKAWDRLPGLMIGLSAARR